MGKHLLAWKPVTCKNIFGADYKAEIPTILEIYARGALLSQILKMPSAAPISFEEAVRKVDEAHFRADIGHEPGQKFWYFAHFVEWISSLGFHIELTGDEFESLSLTDKIS